MQEMKYDFPEYDQEVINFISKVLIGFFSLHPLYGKMPLFSTRHGGPIRNIPGDNPLDQQMELISIQGSLEFDSIRNSDITTFTIFLFNLAESHIVGFSKEFYKVLNEIIGATGNVFDAGGQPFSFDQYLDMLEKIEIEFKENNEPIFPTIVAPPELFERICNLSLTPEQEERLGEIIEKKRQVYDAQKRTRRLS
ncbi:MAG: hypothetical protein A2W35_13385 [Chloroflexi bacterium RBG_16_57_11]|nr:MAG: hypothetical protein A2W35_13385 [Chloroflexi bacterium RBG_16_57_11]